MPENSDYIRCGKCSKPLWGAIRKADPEPRLENLRCLPCFEKEPGAPRLKCRVPGCDEPILCRGFCPKHYTRANYWVQKSDMRMADFEANPKILILGKEELRRKLGIGF